LINDRAAPDRPAQIAHATIAGPGKAGSTVLKQAFA
jgi:hypothetical protein